MRTIWIATLVALAPAAQAQEQTPGEEELIRRDGALIYGPGYDEAYRAGLAEGYEAGFDDGRHEEAAVRAQDRSREAEGVVTTVTTAGYGDGRTRFTQVPRATGKAARGRRR